VLADDLITLFVFWELTSVTSFLLIGFRHEDKAARDAALQALLVTGGGGLALLAGLILLMTAALQAGAPLSEAGRLSHLASIRDPLVASPLYLPALTLILLGAFAKSAQVPLHFWLPGAMSAPTPVSAYLHSATMVKAGVYLLARLHPALGDTFAWHASITTVGTVTMLAGAALALGQRDLKRILAYTTVSALGTLTLLIGLGSAAALKAAAVFLVAHALYKAALFMVAGNVDHAAGTRDVTRLGGLWRVMPVTAASACVAALSMAGAPPLFGFIGKELSIKAKLDLELLGAALIGVAFVANACQIAMALVVSTWPFFRRRGETLEQPHEAPLDMLVGPAALAVAGVFIGLIPAVFDESIGAAAVSSMAGRDVEMKLKLWHGLNPVALSAVGISGLTLLLGVWLYFRLHTQFERTVAAAHRLSRVGPTRVYERGLPSLLDAARAVTLLTQNGRLRRYVTVLLIVTLALAGWPLIRAAGAGLRTSGPTPHLHELALAALVAAGAGLALLSTSRVGAVAALGATGWSLALIFALYGAPDLALTLVLVETLTVVLFVLLLPRLPPFRDLRTRRQRLGSALLALGVGATMGGLVLASAATSWPAHVGAELARASAPLAYGRNVVNVILVDFRALDTLGEITVVALAGLGVHALLRRSAGAAADGDR
jgi:multicomponent Na+:H+ antiporter subunit A